MKRAAKADDPTSVLEQWWERHTGQQVDSRSFRDLPLGVVLLRFYRSCAARLAGLEALTRKDAGDIAEMDRLKKILSETEEGPSYLDQVVKEYKGIPTSTSGDPLWDEYVRRVSEGDIPDSWWGPKGPPKGAR